MQKITVIWILFLLFSFCPKQNWSLTWFVSRSKSIVWATMPKSSLELAWKTAVSIVSQRGSWKLSYRSDIPCDKNMTGYKFCLYRNIVQISGSKHENTTRRSAALLSTISKMQSRYKLGLKIETKINEYKDDPFHSIN